MNYLDIVGQFKDLVNRIEITDKKLFVNLKSPLIYAGEFTSICNTLERNGYKLYEITTDKQNSILIVFVYIE